MPKGTPLHSRTFEACKSFVWIPWGEFVVPGGLSESFIEEYNTLRGAAALFDCSGFGQYHLKGRNAAKMLDYIMTRELSTLKPNRVIYSPWCDHDGKVRLDGTVFRFDEEWYMVCTEPDEQWFRQIAEEFGVEFTNRRTLDAVMALQGPASYKVLREISDIDVESIPFFGFQRGLVADVPAVVSRTGYSGDLGFEIWVQADLALRVWDAIAATGAHFDAKPCGMNCLDIARVEAGFLFAGSDYIPVTLAENSWQTSYPFEIGLGWAVDLKKKSDFVGARALGEVYERGGGPNRLVGVEFDHASYEAEFKRRDVIPVYPTTVLHDPIPVYSPAGGRQIGRMASRVLSPMLNRYIGMALIESSFSEEGAELEVECTVDAERRRASATVVKLPFVKLERTRAPIARQQGN